MAQSPKGGLYGSRSKGHLGVCAIYSETVNNSNWKLFGLSPLQGLLVLHLYGSTQERQHVATSCGPRLGNTHVRSFTWHSHIVPCRTSKSPKSFGSDAWLERKTHRLDRLDHETFPEQRLKDSQGVKLPLQLAITRCKWFHKFQLVIESKA